MSLNEVVVYFRHLKRLGYRRCGITASFLVDSAGRDHVRKLCLPWHVVYHSLPAFWKCSDLARSWSPLWTSDLCPLNSPDFSPVDYKIWDNESTGRKWCNVWWLIEWHGMKQHPMTTFVHKLNGNSREIIGCWSSLWNSEPLKYTVVYIVTDYQWFLLSTNNYDGTMCVMYKCAAFYLNKLGLCVATSFNL